MPSQSFARLCAQFAAATLLMQPSIAAATSPQPWATYQAPKRVSPITIDGDLSDWKEVKPFTMDEKKYFFVGQGISSSQWKGPKDLSATFQLQWDESSIYIAVHVVDDRVTEPHGSLSKTMETGSWDDDGIELMFDNDGCNMSRYYVGDPAHHEFHFVYSKTHPFVFDNFWVHKTGALQPMFTLPDGSKEPLAYSDEEMSKHEVTEVFSKPPYNGTFAFARTPDGYNLELRMSLPLAQMKPIDKGGRRIGFDIAVNDNDKGQGPLKQELHWSGVNGMFWRDTKVFGTLFLEDTTRH